MPPMQAKCCQAAAGPDGGCIPVCWGSTGCRESRSRQLGVIPQPTSAAATAFGLIEVAGQQSGGGRANCETEGRSRS